MNRQLTQTKSDLIIEKNVLDRDPPIKITSEGSHQITLSKQNRELMASAAEINGNTSNKLNKEEISLITQSTVQIYLNNLLLQAKNFRFNYSHSKAWELIEQFSMILFKTTPWELLLALRQKHHLVKYPEMVQKWLIEVAICAYYVEKKSLGAIAADLLLNRPKLRLEHYLKDQSLQNLYFCLDPIQISQKINLNRFFPAPSGYFHSNPSIVWDSDNEAFLINCRMVNYTQQGATNYRSTDSDGKIRTRNLLRWFQFELVDSTDQSGPKFSPIGDIIEVIDPHLKYQVSSPQVLGLEDVRLFKRSKDWWFTATSCPANKTGRPLIVLGELGKLGFQLKEKLLEDNSDGVKETSDQTKIDEDKSEKSKKKESERKESEGKESDFLQRKILSITPLIAPRQNPIEKNWTVFNNLILYSIDPLVVLDFTNLDQYKDNLDSIPAKLSLLSETHSDALDLSHCRGGGSPIPFQTNRHGKSWKTYLTITHEVYFKDKERVYYHRWILFGRKKKGKYQVLEISKPFYIFHLGIEFVGSLTRDEKFIYLGVGIEDREAWLLKLEPWTIRDQLYLV